MVIDVLSLVIGFLGFSLGVFNLVLRRADVGRERYQCLPKVKLEPITTTIPNLFKFSVSNEGEQANNIRLIEPITGLENQNQHKDVLGKGDTFQLEIHTQPNQTRILLYFEDRIGTKYQIEDKYIGKALSGNSKQNLRGNIVERTLRSFF